MKKKYSIKELSTILGCSVTAVNKKLKYDPENPVIKRYKNVHETVVEGGITYILLSDSELEHEKACSRGFNNVINNGYTTPQNDDIVDIEPVATEQTEERLINFTERYMKEFTTLQKTYYEEMREKDKQIYLLTTSENQKEKEYLQAQALNKSLTEQNTNLINRNNVLKLVLTTVITLLLTFITLYIVALNPKTEKVVVEEVQPVQTVQKTVNKTPQKVNKTVSNRK
ncbi:hypothetical protein J6R97_06690 [bacterium]|nr:hypothetical protein [bacterium]